MTCINIISILSVMMITGCNADSKAIGGTHPAFANCAKLVDVDLSKPAGNTPNKSHIPKDQVRLSATLAQATGKLNATDSAMKSCKDLKASIAFLGKSTPDDGNTYILSRFILSGNGALKGGYESASKISLKALQTIATIITSPESVVGLGADTLESPTTAQLAAAKIKTDAEKGSAESSCAKVAAVAGGIALLSLIKGGKLAASRSAGRSRNVQSNIAQVKKAGVNAFNKLLNAIKNQIKTALQKIKIVARY
ncbi:hypothetical protein CR532_04550 (plasmid) [Candidatus Borreliella tachyglossi]|uniref:Variable large protein n=1 Tax=Candidatus Borreliella tachyglossi TaxID=1964448 RepID=A0A2S1LYD1_9SPIR|nr:hypothetical protein CR532_04550 [Candidatus Borreliella tachyglossi]